MKMLRIVAWIVVIAASAGIANAGGGTALTYQGRLLEAGEPANGLFDFEFRLWDAEMGGSQIGSTQIHNAVPVADGLFLILLDFGADAFTNADRWLAVTVDTVLLSPRQPVTRVPYAIQTRGIVVDAVQNVGIGTTAPAYPLEVVSDRSRTINARNTATSGASDGVWGQTASSSGWGVFGFASALSGSTNGTRGQSLSTSGTGVLGLANAGSGNNIGVSGESTSPDGTGVLGLHSASSGTGPGVFGKTNSTSASAVGVLGRVNSASPGSFSAAVRGENLGTSGFGIGVWGSQDGSGWGVYGTTSGGIGCSAVPPPSAERTTACMAKAAAPADTISSLMGWARTTALPPRSAGNAASRRSTSRLKKWPVCAASISTGTPTTAGATMSA